MKLKINFFQVVARRRFSGTQHSNLNLPPKPEALKIQQLYRSNKKLIDIEAVAKKNNFFEKMIQ